MGQQTDWQVQTICGRYIPDSIFRPHISTEAAIAVTPAATLVRPQRSVVGLPLKFLAANCAAKHISWPRWKGPGAWTRQSKATAPEPTTARCACFPVRDRKRAGRRQFDRVARDKGALRCACAQNTIKPVTAGFSPPRPRANCSGWDRTSYRRIGHSRTSARPLTQVAIRERIDTIGRRRACRGGARPRTFCGRYC
jgi:hypothetical protein